MSQTILLVEDDDKLASLVAEFLESNDYQVQIEAKDRKSVV